MIRSFADRRTAAVFERRPVRGIARELGEQVRRKLRQIDEAGRLDELRSPPGNRLEALRGDRAGTFSVRVNAQWRVCFRWGDGHAYAVELTDYH